MLLIPRATEKTYRAITNNTYAFMVPADASKQAIAKAVSEEFKVTVLNVKTLIRKGKAMCFSRGRRAYPGITHRQDKKIAYITVKAGDKIPVFEDQTNEAEAKSEDKKGVN